MSILRRKLTALADEPLVREKCRDFDQILQACLGLVVESTLSKAEVSPGDFVAIEHSVSRKGKVPVTWLGVRYPTLNKDVKQTYQLPLDRVVNVTQCEVLPQDIPVSQPDRLREPPRVGVYRVADASLIGQPLGPSPLPVEHEFEVEGQTFVVPIVPTARVVENGKRVDRALEVVPPVFLWLPVRGGPFRRARSEALRSPCPAVARVSPASSHCRRRWAGRLRLARRSFRSTRVSKPNTRSRLTPPAHATSASIVAQATVGGRTYDNGRVDIRYDHIGHLLLQPTSRLTAASFDLNIRGRNVGYVEAR